MPRVSVFISWSGNSRALATVLHEWLPTALHSIDPWMSDNDIQKGTRFFEEIDRALGRCQAGIVCLTPENSESVWIAFEAGALANRVQSAKLVIPVIARMRPSELRGPLRLFQAAQLNKQDILHLVKGLNSLNLADDKIPEKRLEATFEGVWPDLENRLAAIEPDLLEGENTEHPQKSNAEILEEILAVTKAMKIVVDDRLRDIAAATPAAADEITKNTAMSEPVQPLNSGAGLRGRDNYRLLKNHILEASEVWLSGVSLLAVLKQYYNEFREYVDRERISLRFMVLDPADDLLIDSATRSLYGVTAAADLRQDISAAIEQINSLMELGADSQRVQLRYMANVPGTSIIMTNPMDANGSAIAEFYPYRASSSDRPHVFLSHSESADQKWFLFYRDQFLAMWRDARRAEDGDRNE